MANALAAGYSLTYFDEFIYNLTTEERVCDIILPRIAKRQTLEENGEIGPRKSRLLDAMEGKSEDGASRRSHSTSRSLSRSRSPSVKKDRSPSVNGRYVSRSPTRSRSPSQLSYRSRTRSISPDRMEAEHTTDV